MNCDSARELLLTADLADLAGRTDGPLADHLRSCATCRAAAERLLESHDELRNVLAAARPRRPTADVVRAAVQAAERRRATIRRVRRVLPLAAAATLVGVLIARRQPERPGNHVPSGPGMIVPARFSVTAPPGRNVAVLRQSDNPDVFVVWFF